MLGRLKRPILMLTAGCLLAAAGCSPGLTALAKFQSGDIGSLTASDWQNLAGLGSSLGVAVPQLTAQQADAIVKFLDDNHVQTTQDLQNVLHSGNITVPAELVDLFG